MATAMGDIEAIDVSGSATSHNLSSQGGYSSTRVSSNKTLWF
jgi:hypothetical protein